MSKPRLLTAVSLLSLIGLAACSGAVENSGDASEQDMAIMTGRSASLALACAGCHSEKSSAVVDLHGYDADLMRDALLRYKAETDGTTVMHRLARGYSEVDIILLAAHFSDQGREP